jgi:hypothetical protein
MSKVTDRQSIGSFSSAFSRSRRFSNSTLSPNSAAAAATRGVSPYRELHQWDKWNEPLIQFDPSAPSPFDADVNLNFGPSLLDLDIGAESAAGYEQKIRSGVDRSLPNNVLSQPKGIGFDHFDNASSR